MKGRHEGAISPSEVAPHARRRRIAPTLLPRFISAIICEPATVTGYGDSLLNAAVLGFSLDILDPDTAPFPQSFLYPLDTAQKARSSSRSQPSQSSSDVKPIRIRAGFLLRVMTIPSPLGSVQKPREVFP